MKQSGLGKSHKLCGKTAIDRLFSRSDASSLLAYPLRAVWGMNDMRTSGEPVQFLITVPKKRLRHAVDRVKMRRRVREAYRLNRPRWDAATPVTDIAFIYISDQLEPYVRVEKAMKRILHKAFPQPLAAPPSGHSATSAP